MGPFRHSYSRLIAAVGAGFVAVYVYGYDDREMASNFGPITDQDVYKNAGLKYVDENGRVVVPPHQDWNVIKRFWDAITHAPNGPLIQYWREQAETGKTPERAIYADLQKEKEAAIARAKEKALASESKSA